MSLVDERGRILGRVNLVDGALVAFLFLLLPVGYGTYLLFRPASPTIESVTQVDLTREEFRIASGTTIAAKLKVRGTGFNPLLRAAIGSQQALAFVFENPNSADVVVGEIPPGTYDLILYDGVQEVARANGTVTISYTSGPSMRAVGRLLNLTDAQAKALQPGAKTAAVRGGYEVIAIGPPSPGHQHVSFGGGGVDIAAPGATERHAVLAVQCDGGGQSCIIGGISLSGTAPIQVALDGGIQFVVDELLPAAPPVRAQVDVHFSGPQITFLKIGDRETSLDERAAVIRSIARDAGGVRVTLELGVDSSRDGWAYRGRSIRLGAPFRFVTDRYEIEGTVAAAMVETPAAKTP